MPDPGIPAAGDGGTLDGTGAVAALRPAVAAGIARLGDSPITAAPAKGLARLEARLAAIFAGFPAVAVTGCGVRHDLSGLYFAGLRAGGNDYLAALGATSGPPLPAGLDVIAVTGRCMFGFGAITAWPGPQGLALLQQNNAFVDPGSPIEAISVDPRPHIYEAEGTARAGGFLRDLARVPGMGRVQVWAHIPVIEYQLHGLHLYSRGLMSADAYAAYRAAISERGRMLTQALAGQIGPAATFTAVAPLEWVREVKTGPDPGADLWAAAARQPGQQLSGRLWRTLAELRPDDSLASLGHASYSHVYLAAAAVAARRCHALVLVEDADDEPLFRRTWTAADTAGVPLRQHAVGFYLHPLLVALKAAPGSDGHFLYNVPDGCGVAEQFCARLGAQPPGMPAGELSYLRDLPALARREMAPPGG
jgi:hypothetical protein